MAAHASLNGRPESTECAMLDVRSARPAGTLWRAAGGVKNVTRKAPGVPFEVAQFLKSSEVSKILALLPFSSPAHGRLPHDLGFVSSWSGVRFVPRRK
jgi:hypothetical protein